MSNRLRLFIASQIIGPPATEFLPLIQCLKHKWVNQPQVPELRWTPSDHWHLTWQFLGETPAETIPALQNGLNSALMGKTGFSTHWQQLAWWPSKNRPQILVGLLESSPPLQAMADVIAQTTALRPTENSNADHVQPKRKEHASRTFKPHITLARLKHRGVRGPMPDLPSLPDGLPVWRVDAITLFQSELHSSGAIHTPLFTIPLIAPTGE